MALLALLLIPYPELAGQHAVDSSRVVRILTYNILHGETLKGDFDLDRIACGDHSGEPGPGGPSGSGLSYPAGPGTWTWSANWESGQRLVPLFGRAMYFDGGEYGEGILSAIPLSALGIIPCHAGEGKNPGPPWRSGCCFRAGIPLPLLAPISIIPGDVDRIDQACDAEGDLLAAMRLPTILAGDLNAQTGESAMEILV